MNNTRIKANVLKTGTTYVMVGDVVEKQLATSSILLPGESGIVTDMYVIEDIAQDGDVVYTKWANVKITRSKLGELTWAI